MPQEASGICVDSILESCPFSFVLDAGGRVAKLGSYFAKHHPEIAGLLYDEAFELVDGDATARSLLATLSVRPETGSLMKRVELELREAGGMHVVGSFLSLTRRDEGVLFIGTIAPRDIARVTDYGLSMGDFAPFDVSADFAMMAQVNEAVLKDTRMLNERLAIARDEAVSARKKVEAIALVDTLSGLANRAAFQQRLGASSAAEGRPDEPCSLLLIDIDNFKPINDHYGHAVGDQMIQSIGERIGRAINGQANAYRIGGDEFAVIFHALTPDEARCCVGDIMRAVNEPHRIQDKRIAVKASGGLASRMFDVEDLESLYKAADIALYEAKRSKSRKLQTFTAGMGRRELEKMLLERDLVEAVERAELEVFVQPQFDLHTGALWGGEALARWWNRRLQRYIPPGEFIPIAEKYGLVAQIDLFVFATVLRQQRALGAQAQSITWSSNVSPLTVGQADLPQRLRAIMEQYGAPTAPLEIEITEGAILSEAGTISETLHCIREMGIDVAIDDFGAGQTSLALLTRIPITRLKLDRSLVARIDKDERAETIARSIVALAQELGFRVTAEGIERLSQAERLRRMGPMHTQGFLYAAPMPLADFAALICDGVCLQESGRAVAG
jgi:diguanylate cyclase (GGDEF)-like protein